MTLYLRGWCSGEVWFPDNPKDSENLYQYMNREFAKNSWRSGRTTLICLENDNRLLDEIISLFGKVCEMSDKYENYTSILVHREVTRDLLSILKLSNRPEFSFESVPKGFVAIRARQFPEVPRHNGFRYVSSSLSTTGKGILVKIPREFPSDKVSDIGDEYLLYNEEDFYGKTFICKSPHYETEQEVTFRNSYGNTYIEGLGQYSRLLCYTSGEFFEKESTKCA